MEQVKELLSRFQVPGRVGERAMEYYRLAEVRCRSGVGGATSTGLALVCIEIACTQLGEPFDKVSTSHACCSVCLVHSQPAHPVFRHRKFGQLPGNKASVAHEASTKIMHLLYIEYQELMSSTLQCS